MKQMDFRQNVVIVTGASMGIGRELAYQLAAQGAWLALAARSAPLLKDVAGECERRGARAIAVPTDVTDQRQCRHLIEQTVKTFGRIDTLVNNAGVGMTARFDAVQDLAHYDRIMRTNYLGSVYCTHAALPFLKQTKGRLVAISSLAGKTGVPFYSAYCASKHALMGFFEALRIEIEPQGVSVTLVLPDFVATGTHERSVDADGHLLGKSHSIDYRRAMSTQACARIITTAMARRKRQVLMSARGKIGQWIKLLAPRMIDNLARRAMERGG